MGYKKPKASGGGLTNWTGMVLGLCMVIPIGEGEIAVSRKVPEDAASDSASSIDEWPCSVEDTENLRIE